MTDTESNILDTRLKGVTVRIAWQFIAGIASVIFSILFTYFSLKSTIHDLGLNQSRIDAIQDIRIDALKSDGSLRDLKIKDLTEQINELKASQKQKP